MLKKLIALFAFLSVLGTAGAAAAIFSLSRPVTTQPSTSETFIIPKGQAVSVIANRLAEENYIKNALVWRLLVKQQGLENKIQAGSFQLSPSMTPIEIAQELTTGTEDLWITVLEGWRVEEIADMLDRQEQLTEFDKAEFLELAKPNEGYLFPETYLMPKLIDSQGIFELLTDTFDTKVTTGLDEEIMAFDQPLEDVIIMASLVEREARGLEEMQMVAGILWKRLEIGMPLQVDATLQYQKGYNAQLDQWWVPPTAQDRQTPTPFNTYTNPGLPPRPIANPGLEAITATLTPIESEYLFYIHGRDGVIRYAETLDQHNANIQRYLR